MRKVLSSFFLIGLLLACSLFYGSLAFAEEDIEYRFERLWPRLEQPWDFKYPRGITIAPSGIYVSDSVKDHIQQFSIGGELIRSWKVESPVGLAVAPDGSVYVISSYHNNIQQFNAKGEFILSWEVDAPQDIAVAPDGSIYITDAKNHRIQKFSAEGKYILEWEVGNPTGDGFSDSFPTLNIVIADDGSIYVSSSDSDNIQKFNATGEFIHSWGGYGSDNGRFKEPQGLAIASDGSIYVSSYHRIQHFTSKGDFIRGWGRFSYEGGGTSDMRVGNFEFPKDVAVAQDGSVYVVDAERIQQFSDKGDFIKAWEYQNSSEGNLSTPRDLALAPNGSVYVTDTGNNRIQQFSAQGDFIRTWGRSGNGLGDFKAPKGLAIDPDSSIYVADTENNRIQKFSAEGAYIRGWGGWGERGEGDGQFNSPLDLAIAPSSDVYVADTGNHRIQQFNAKGEFIRKWTIASPRNLAISPDGNIYVSAENDSIQKFTATGDFIQKLTVPTEDLTIAPDGSLYALTSNRILQFNTEGDLIDSWEDKELGDGQLNGAVALAIASNGSVYTSDVRTHRIYKFVSRKKGSPTHLYKSVILAGGGKTFRNGRINDIWEGTWQLTQKAYNALIRQDFVIHEEIKFLTAGSTQFDLDNNKQFDDLEPASKDSLRRAITEWATDAKDVVIYLSNHGGPNKFKINGSETLSGEELDNWVSELEQRIPGTVTIIIEACNSASFFEKASKSGRFLFASTKADQPAIISNQGLTSFSYYFWSEIATGTSVKHSFFDARNAMSQVSIGKGRQTALAETNGNQTYDKGELDILGDYCLGNCNKTQGAPPEIITFNANTQVLNGETAQDITVTVDSTQELDKVWAIVQRPDDISIDPDQPLNFEKIQLLCDKQGKCQGRYEGFDIKGEYRLNVYALDREGEISFPENLTITQTQGKAVIPVQYDEQKTIVYLRDVLVNGQHLQAALELQGGKFVVIAYSIAPEQFSPAAQFDIDSGLLSIPHALAYGQEYQASFKYLGGLDFDLLSAEPK